MVNPKQAPTEHRWLYIPSAIISLQTCTWCDYSILDPYFLSISVVHDHNKQKSYHEITGLKKKYSLLALLGILDPSQSVTSCACNKRSRVQRSIGWRQNCTPKSLAVELSNNTYQRWCKHNFNIILYQVVTMPSSDSNKLILRSWHKKGYSGIENPLNKTHKQRIFFYF